MSEVTITVSGPVGSGKSALVGEIEILMRALGVPVRYANPTHESFEKNVRGADWQSDLELYKPSVVLVEHTESQACQHAGEHHVGWDYLSCKACGAFCAADHGWGIARGMWFKSRTEAQFYMRNGRLPDALGLKGGA